jgi:hypothetical protein
VLGLDGLSYIVKHGKEPVWFHEAYITSYGVAPPP